MPSPLLDFYHHQGADHAGRSLRKVWAFSHDELERQHDFIQWLFPLPEPSGVLPQAPILTPDDIDAFVRNESLRHTLRCSLNLMLDFYGYEWRGGEVGAAPNAMARQRVWLTRGNHNFLRLTRMLRSLTLLGEGVAAQALLGALEAIAAEYPEVVGATTVRYWRGAVRSGQ